MTNARNLGPFSIVLAAGLLTGVAACADEEAGANNAAAAADAKGGWVAPANWQNWNDEDRDHWYQATQGSRLLPWAWAKALEQSGSDQLFFTPQNLEKFRFVPYAKSKNNLPIGFAVDDNKDDDLTYTKLRWYRNQPNNEQWLGLNCSACHTAQIDFEGKRMTLDGSQSLVDFQSFIEQVDASLAATQSDPAKWDRFARKVLEGRDNEANRALLKDSFAKLVAWEKENARLNNTRGMRYGYGRLDAFGHIFNKVAQLAVYGMTPPAPRATPNPSDAPVNYPFLWDIYRQSRLQWNGIIDVLGEDGKPDRIELGGGRYLDYSALGRNAGEVIGVFGDVAVKPARSFTGFNSSIWANNLDRLENMLRRLQAPKWPGTLDSGAVARGKTLFGTKGCKGCHAVQPPGNNVYDVTMVPLTRDSNGVPNRNNTDPWMACNAISYSSASGKLQGQPSGYFSGAPLKEDDLLATMLETTVIGTLLGKWKQILDTTAQIFFNVEPLPRVVQGAADQVSPEEERAGRLDACFKAPPATAKLFAYKARPLDGIWASPPYLHNGSVPSLYELLLAPAARTKSFPVGTRLYDPAKGGYSVDPAAAGNEFTFTASGHGNSNEGHDYKVGDLEEADRLALLEYLKSL